MLRERAKATNFSPAILASGVLHGLAAAALLIAWPHASKPITLGSAVPVTIVANGPVTNVRPAEQAPEEQIAQTEDPIPDEAPAPAAPAPVPAPPAPAPTPAPKTTPVPTKPAPKPVQKTAALDFDALSASVARRQKAGGGPARSQAQRGPARQETSVQARQAVGAASALSASALGFLAAELQRRWNPNCEVEGGQVDIRVGFRLAPGGAILGQVDSTASTAIDPVVKASSDRAIRAVMAAAPFENLPPELFGQRIVVNFNAKQACSG